MSLWDTNCPRKLTSNLVSQRDRDFPLKFDVSFTLEISDKILRLQQLLLLALIPKPYTHLIVKFVIQQTKFAYIMQISYLLVTVFLWYNVHNPKKYENVTKYWRIYP